MYVFFGGSPTVVNWVGYWLLADLLHVPYLWATAIAQIAAILFAYVTNRIWVFQSKAKGLGPVLGRWSASLAAGASPLCWTFSACG